MQEESGHSRKSPPENDKKCEPKPDVVINMPLMEIHTVGGVLVNMPHVMHKNPALAFSFSPLKLQAYKIKHKNLLFKLSLNYSICIYMCIKRFSVEKA